MLDQISADRVLDSSDGVALEAGAYRFSFLTSHRDRNVLLERPSPVVVFCQVEFDVTSGTISALAFADDERRGLYRVLRKVNGIGRASAFAVLDAGELLDTLRAVAGRDVAYFKAVPGLGPKKIEAVIKALATFYGGRLPQPVASPVALLVEARDALIQHGLAAGVAEQALWDSWRDGTKRAEDWGERALAILGRA